MELFFSALTAVATTITCVVALAGAFFKYKQSMISLGMTGQNYFRKTGSDDVCVSFTFASRQPVYIKTISCVGRKIAINHGDEMRERVAFGLQLAKDSHTDVRYDFWVSPPPKDGEPLVFKVATDQNFLCHKFTFRPSDFTISGEPDQGIWPK